MDTIRRFNQLWHDSNGGTWNDCYWRGVKVLKCPFDLWIYQELIHRVRPSLIIETGTYLGGSALYLADICQLLGHGRVLTIDTKNRARLNHSRIEQYIGSSVAAQTMLEVRKRVADATSIMVILDSNHARDHVLKELELYSKFVTPNSYLIVEDTNIGRDVHKDFGPGPKEALDDWLPKNPRFEVDLNCEKFYTTFNPKGYLKCVH